MSKQDSAPPRPPPFFLPPLHWHATDWDTGSQARRKHNKKDLQCRRVGRRSREGEKRKKKKAEIPTYRFSLSCSSLTLKSCREGKDNNRGELQGWKVEDDCVCVCVNDETGELFIRTNRRGTRFLRRPKKKKKRWFFFKPDQWQNMTGRARDRNAEEPASLHREVMVINAGRRHISTSKWMQE